ncbi:hypothetical protein JS562_48405, partial [Agrobacterium sp. S2]|nr:hypothetical protein [Agrobacterium sp. S2]
METRFPVKILERHQDVERGLRPIKFQISTGGMAFGHNFVSFRSHFGNIRQISDDACHPLARHPS